MILDVFLSFLAHFMHPYYQIGGIIATSAMLIILLYGPRGKFKSTDSAPNILPNIPKKQTAGTESAIEVNVGLYIINFPTFDMIANRFIADIVLWFELDPSLMPLETVQKFSFERGTILSKSEADMKIVGNKLFVKYSIRLQFTTDLDHRLFPFNDHKMFIILKNEYVSPNELLFTASRSSFRVEPNIQTSDWNIVDRATETGYFQAQLHAFETEKIIQYPAVIFSIDLAKKGMRRIFIIMLPMIILFFISVLTFSLDPKIESRSILTLSTGTLTGLIAYRFVIEKIVPDVGYFTRADHLFNLFLTVIFITFLVNLFAVNWGVHDTFLLAVKGLTLVVVELIVLASFYYLQREAHE